MNIYLNSIYHTHTIGIKLKQASKLWRGIFTSLVLALPVTPVFAAISLPNGTINEYAEDMRVKSLGGDVVIDRQYFEGRWIVNQSWKGAVYSGIPQITGSCNAYPIIKVREREYIGDGTAWTLENRYTIRAKDYFTGTDCQANRIQTLRWQDRSTGQWMEFQRADNTQLQYQLVRYGDRNNNAVSLDYNAANTGATAVANTPLDAATQANLNAGKIQTVRDTNNNILYSFIYTGEQLTEVQDNPSLISGNTATPRSVKYAYGSTSYKGQTYSVINQVTDVLGNLTKYTITNGEVTQIEDAQSTLATPRIQNYLYTAGRVTKYNDALGHITTYKYDYDKNKQQFYVRIDSPPASTTTTEHLITENWYDKSGFLIRRDLNGKTDYLKGETDTIARSFVQTDAAGRQTTITKDEYNNIIKTQYPDGSITNATYSPIHGGMLTQTDELGITTRYDYDAKGNLIKTTEALGQPEQRVTEYSVNTQGQITAMTRKGSTISLPVAPVAGSQTVTTPDKTTQYQYDTLGNLTQVTDANNKATNYSFDRLGNVVKITDANNGIWLAEYDARGRVLKKTNPLGYSKQQQYDKVGNLITIKDADNNQTQLNYDANNQLTSQQDPLGNTQTMQYDGAGRITTLLDATNNPISSLQYDARGRLIARKDAAGNITQTTYDDASGANTDPNMPSQISFANMTRKFNYDNRRRLTSTQDSAGTTTYTNSSNYDQRSQLITSTDANGNSHAMQYDALGHLIQSTDPLTGTTKLNYDSHDNLIAVTDANNNVTQYQYDHNNRTVKEIRPLGEALSYAYDNVGNLTTSTDTTGNIINYTYDAANRRIQETHTAVANTTNTTSGINTGLTRTIAYTYNKVGTLTGYTDSNTGHADNQAHSVTYTLDALQRRLADNITVGNQTISLASTYNANGNKASQTQPDATGNPVSVNYSYDSAQQLKDILLPNNGTSSNNTNNGGNISITERLFNQASQVLYPGGTLNQLSYDGFGRLAQLKYKSPNQQTLLQRNYQYDPMSNITRVDENKAIASNTSTTNTNAYLYQYDQLYRLTNADNPSGLPDEQYAYDKLGNRLLDNGKPNPASANQQWQYNGNNQLTQSATVDTATFGSNARAIDHRYDANGNLAQLTTELTTPNQTGTALANPYDNQQYRYDAQNRLTAVQDSLGNLIASYQYDHYGQRIRKTIHRILQADGTWLALSTPNGFSYFYRDEGLSAQYQTAGQDVTATTATNITSPKQIAQYGWLPNGVWGTNPVWINTSKRTTTTANSQTTTTISPPDYYYYQNDHLGTPQQLIDSAGKLVWQQQSTAFGEAQLTIGDASNETHNAASSVSNTQTTGVIANPFRFAGQYYDLETNTNYNYHRQYNFREGGYTQTDPIGLAGGMNRQGYVMGNPITGIDPRGLECISTKTFTSCSFPGGGPMFTLQTPDEFPDSIAPDSPINLLLYHNYDIQVPLNGADPKCVMRKLINNPTPGNPKPASANGTTNNAAVTSLRDNLVTSYLTHDLKTRAPLVVNLTNSGSQFSPGYVARTVTGGFVHTYGEGLSVAQSPYLPLPYIQEYMNDKIWRKQMREIVDSCNKEACQ